MNQNKSNSILSLITSNIDINGKLPNLALLLLRIFAGFTIMSAGLDKLPNKDWMIEQVTSLGFPFPAFFAWLASFSEFAFGAMLVLGLLTRVSGLVLAITMGVAAFGFHKVTPLVSMHITQHFFWIFVLFTFLGGGKLSLDHLISQKTSNKISGVLKIGLSVFAILLTYGILREYTQEEVEVQEKIAISSINIPGSFNDWNFAANEMEKLNESNYRLKVDFEEAGVIEFKFTLNKSWDINFGDDEQKLKGFPIDGVAQNNGGNIQAYIPKPGTYLFELNSSEYSYSLDSLR